MIRIFLYLFISCLIISCDRKVEGTELQPLGCIFDQDDSKMEGLIDETERAIMDACINYTWSSEEALQNNLIGEWELIGHGEGWVPTISQPCAYIVINENDLIFSISNSYLDTTIVYSWSLQLQSGIGLIPYTLSLNPTPIEGLQINHFCENYMFGDGTPADGNMYLYEKVK